MTTPFRDLYEDLQLSPNASGETVERVYRLLAGRYADNRTRTAKFSEVHAAYELLTDPERRAATSRMDSSAPTPGASSTSGRRMTIRKTISRSSRASFHCCAARRQNPAQGGLGSVSLEKTLGCPREHLDFPSGIEGPRLDRNARHRAHAITVEGIDKVTSRDFEVPADRLLLSRRPRATMTPARRAGSSFATFPDGPTAPFTV